MYRVSRALAFVRANERRLGAIAFFGGFVTDLLTFTLLPFPLVSAFFATHLGITSGSALAAHALSRLGSARPVVRWALVALPLVVQYSLGALLSGLVVFYTAHASLSASWPFLALLALVFVGNEYFRKYRDYLVFQTVLLFAALYAYLVFALPLATRSLGPWTFLGSTLLAAVVFGAFLFALRAVNFERFAKDMRRIVAICALLTLFVTGSYLGGLIPPLPLALADIGIYHGISRTAEGYALQAEARRPWWEAFPFVRDTLHALPGSTLVGYSAVTVPPGFSLPVVHHWEQNAGGRWMERGKVSFNVSGGREEGYRGYSEKTSVTPGQWRLSVETRNGQVIGRTYFNVRAVGELPLLETVIR